MTDAEKIYKSLKFLEEEYGFKSDVFTDGRQINISFYNNSGCFTYHVYPQFGDFNLFISDSLNGFRQRLYRKIYSLDWLADIALPIYKKEYPSKKIMKQ